MATAAAMMIKIARLSYRTDSQTVKAIVKAASTFGGTVNLQIIKDISDQHNQMKGKFHDNCAFQSANPSSSTMVGYGV